MNLRTHLRYIAFMLLGLVLASSWWGIGILRQNRALPTEQDPSWPVATAFIIITLTITVAAIWWCLYVLIHLIFTDKDDV